MEQQYIVIMLVVFFGVSVTFSYLINYLFLKFSFNLGSRQNRSAEQIRWASTVKPAIGGISFFIVFLISISFIGALPRESSFLFDKKLLGIITASSLGFLLGLADDAYNTNPLVKFIGQLSCAFILIISDVYIQATGVESLDFVLTTVWVIGLMNSINMLDNMDGITTSVSASIIIGLIAVIAITDRVENNFYLFMLVGVLGGLAGFLFFNWYPSRIYMGDTGSQFLGVFLASTSIMYLWQFRENPRQLIELKQFVIPMLFFIVPLIDTTTVTIRRLMRKQSPFVGGKDHITHHLAYLGLSDKNVAVILLLLSLVSIPIVILALTGVINWGFEFTLASFIYFFVVFMIFQLLYNKGKAMHLAKQKQ